MQIKRAFVIFFGRIVFCILMKRAEISAGKEYGDAITIRTLDKAAQEKTRKGLTILEEISALRYWTTFSLF